MNKKNLVTWISFAIIFFAVLQFFNKKDAPLAPAQSNAPVSIVTDKSDYVSDSQDVKLKIRNNTATAITLPSNCPKNPFHILVWNGTTFEERTAESKISCELSPDIMLKPGEEKVLSYSYWNHALFGEPGRYKIEISATINNKQQTIDSPEFTVTEAGLFRKLFRSVLYQPLYNLLVFFISIAPGRDLGFAIILLTLLIKLILLVPSQRAITSQRRMQEMQPKLDEIKKKYAGNQERIASETMQIWKEHKVNPFGSCLPLLIQSFVLIALFYAIRSVLNPDNIHFLYEPLKNIDLSTIHTNFLGILDLTRVNPIVLPLIVGGLQFFQLKLSLLRGKDGKKDEEKSAKPASEMESANKMMVYVMPVMIALFTASAPAGVGLYWGISTAFALAQQAVANRKRI